MSSMENVDGAHCEEMGGRGGCQNNTAFSEEYSRVEPKTKGAEPSEGMVEARSEALRGCQVADPRSGAGPTATAREAPSHVEKKCPKGSLCAPSTESQRGQWPLGAVFAGRNERIIRSTAGKPSGCVDRKLRNHHGFDGQCRERLFH